MKGFDKATGQTAYSKRGAEHGTHAGIQADNGTAAAEKTGVSGSKGGRSMRMIAACGLIAILVLSAGCPMFNHSITADAGAPYEPEAAVSEPKKEAATSVPYQSTDEQSDPEPVITEPVRASTPTPSTQEETSESKRKHSSVVYEEWLSDLILYGQNNTYTEYDLAGLSYDQLWVVRNGMFALYGKIFKSRYLQNFFDQCPWYMPITSNDEVIIRSFSDCEWDNIHFTEEMEALAADDDDTYTSYDPPVVDSWLSDLIWYGKEHWYDVYDLAGLDKRELRIVRNGMYALFGAYFNDASLQRYYEENCSWYDPVRDAQDATAYFNDCQWDNIHLIEDLEEGM